MALNAALKQLIDTKLAHTRAPQWALPIAEVRQAFRNLWTPALTGEPVSIAPHRGHDDSRRGCADSGARLRAGRCRAPCPVMLYFHGGGYVKGGIEESDAFCRNLARATRHVVLSIDYRLAPEHRFPAALDDAVAATIWARTHAGDIGGAAGSDRRVRRKRRRESGRGHLSALAVGPARRDPLSGIAAAGGRLHAVVSVDRHAGDRMPRASRGPGVVLPRRIAATGATRVIRACRPSAPRICPVCRRR